MFPSRKYHKVTWITLGLCLMTMTLMVSKLDRSLFTTQRQSLVTKGSKNRLAVLRMDSEDVQASEDDDREDFRESNRVNRMLSNDSEEKDAEGEENDGYDEKDEYYEDEFDQNEEIEEDKDEELKDDGYKDVQEDQPDPNAKVRIFPFDPNGGDVLVMLHIQKTGGSSFETHLVLHTDMKPPCNCTFIKKGRYVCQCPNKHGRQWMFQRASVGWPCGTHADFTQLTDGCVQDWFQKKEGDLDVDNERRFHFITLLREPVSRFLSEWQVVHHGAEWGEMKLTCGGRMATLKEIPPCPKVEPGVTFQQFIGCPSNLAINRQTRMLANLSLSDCYRLDSKLSPKQRASIMLQSAKQNIAKFFHYFGLLEHLHESVKLFNKTFPGLAFDLSQFEQRPESDTNAGMAFGLLNDEQLKKVREINSLDVELYKFARQVFLSRLQQMDIQIGRYKR